MSGILISPEELFTIKFTDEQKKWLKPGTVDRFFSLLPSIYREVKNVLEKISPRVRRQYAKEVEALERLLLFMEEPVNTSVITLPIQPVSFYYKTPFGLVPANELIAQILRTFGRVPKEMIPQFAGVTFIGAIKTMPPEEIRCLIKVSPVAVFMSDESFRTDALASLLKCSCIHEKEIIEKAAELVWIHSKLFKSFEEMDREYLEKLETIFDAFMKKGIYLMLIEPLDIALKLAIVRPELGIILASMVGDIERTLEPVKPS